MRITVRSSTGSVVREGTGSSEGRSATAYEAHSMGLKGAETDATKRALATFGNAFGLTLYSDERRDRSAAPSVDEHPQRSVGRSIPVARAQVKDGPEALEPFPRGPFRTIPQGSHRSFPPRTMTTVSVEADAPRRLQNAIVDTEAGNGDQGIEDRPHETPSRHKSHAPDTSPVPGRIDKSMLAISTPKRQRDK